MSESRQNQDREERVIVVRVRHRASAEEVVAQLLEAARPTDISLLTVFGDGGRVYPFGGQDPRRTASSWRAKLLWHQHSDDPGEQLEIFLGRAGLFLNLSDGVRVESDGGDRRAREKAGR